MWTSLLQASLALELGTSVLVHFFFWFWTVILTGFHLIDNLYFVIFACSVFIYLILRKKNMLLPYSIVGCEEYECCICAELQIYVIEN